MSPPLESRLRTGKRGGSEEISDTVQLKKVDVNNLSHAARHQISIDMAEVFFKNRYCINRIPINDTYYIEICKDYSALIYSKSTNDENDKICELYDSILDYIYELFEKYETEEEIFTPSTIKIVQFLYRSNMNFPDNIKEAFQHYLIDPKEKKNVKTTKIEKSYNSFFKRKANHRDILIFIVAIIIILIFFFFGLS
ncbi:MAG: hypothetical protein U9O87_05990 [Verrucomicrobiota bacterium]|nr:hypothetical protein [Verrucomicrobiota bacterium]